MPQLPDEPRTPWTTLASARVFETPWLALRQNQVRTHTGDEITYTYMERHDAVFVVALTATDELLLLRQYRYPVGAWSWEVPAGGIEPEEDGAIAATRELAEEIGGTCGSLRPITWFHPNNGISNERFHVYLATDVQVGANSPEHTELLHVVAVPRVEALRMAHVGAITDGPSALALLLCEPYLSRR